MLNRFCEFRGTNGGWGPSARSGPVPIAPVPRVNDSPSLVPYDGWWHDAQAMSLFPERIGSKNSASPSATMSGSAGGGASSGTTGTSCMARSSARISSRVGIALVVDDSSVPESDDVPPLESDPEVPGVVEDVPGFTVVDEVGASLVDPSSFPSDVESPHPTSNAIPTTARSVIRRLFASDAANTT